MMLLLDIAAFAVGVWVLRRARTKGIQVNKKVVYGALGLLILSIVPLLIFGMAQSIFGLFEGDSGLGLGLFYFVVGMIAKIILVGVAIRTALR